MNDCMMQQKYLTYCQIVIGVQIIKQYAYYAILVPSLSVASVSVSNCESWARSNDCAYIYNMLMPSTKIGSTIVVIQYIAADWLNQCGVN